LGLKTTSSLVTIADFDPLIAEVAADEKDIKDILKDQKVSLTLDAYPEKLLSGTVKEAGMALVTGAEGTQGYPVKIEIHDSKGISPRQGLSVDAEITTQTRENTLYLPYEAVLEEDGKNFVFKVQDDLAKKKEVKIGLETKDNYEIVSGLKEGDKVIVSDLDTVVDGQKVKIK
jgi:RND family efflux transporter MFP subunit